MIDISHELTLIRRMIDANLQQAKNGVLSFEVLEARSRTVLANADAIQRKVTSDDYLASARRGGPVLTPIDGGRPS